MLLYKGRSNLSETQNYNRFAKEIKTNEWWHSHSDYLNDCFEMLPSIQIKNIEQIIKLYGISIRKNNPKEYKKFSKLYTQTIKGNYHVLGRGCFDYFNSLSMNIVSDWKEKIGILSLTTKYPDPLMIGKYSNGGVVVEFVSDESEKSLTKVEYSKQRPTLVLDEMLNYILFPQTIPEDFTRYMLATKSEVWFDENEYRSVRVRGEQENKPEGFVSSVEGLEINRILVNPKDDGTLFNKLKCDLSGVEIVKTKLHPTDYSIIEIP